MCDQKITGIIFDVVGDKSDDLVDNCVDSSLMQLEIIEYFFSDQNVTYPTNGACAEIHEVLGPTILENSLVRMIFSTCYVLIWLMGFVGNGLVLFLVATWSYFRFKHKNSQAIGKVNSAFPVRSVFVISLACSDMLITVTSLPITAVTIFSQIWIFPSFMCNCISFIQAFSIFQSSFTFTSIAIDRYLLITRPKPILITRRLARAIVISTAVLAAALASPMTFLMKTEPLAPICGQFCVEVWPSLDQQTYYGISVMLLQLALPAVVTSVCYALIAYRLKASQKNRFSSRNDGSATPARWRANRRRLRTNKMMACMVGIFILLWTPFNLINLLRDLNLSIVLFQKDNGGNDTFKLLHASAHLLAMASVVWNPIMYAWYNKTTRNVLRPVLKLFRRKMHINGKNHERALSSDFAFPL